MERVIDAKLQAALANLREAEELAVAERDALFKRGASWDAGRRFQGILNIVTARQAVERAAVERTAP